MSAPDPMAKYATMETSALRSVYGGLSPSSERLNLRGLIREREKAHQGGYDAGQVLLDVLGGFDVQEMHARAIDASMRRHDAKQYLEAGQAMGMADALWEYIQDRSDT